MEVNTILCDGMGCSAATAKGTQPIPAGWIKVETSRYDAEDSMTSSKTEHFCPACIEKRKNQTS